MGSTGHSVALSDGAPALPAEAWSRAGQPMTAKLGTSSFRLLAIRVPGGWLVAGQSLADTADIENVLVAAEIIAGPIFILAMFFGALVIGLKASGPVEQARLRQLEFTADASHELRTPLSVIEAEVDLALGTGRGASKQRDIASYRDSLQRVGHESKRLRHIVDDLLWLARFDSQPPPPGDAPVDLATIAEGCADRFSGVAHSRNIEISVGRGGNEHAWINAPPEWIDRLTGVLVDNACRYAGHGGKVHIQVTTIGNRVSLFVEDERAGYPPVDRPRLFDRFHRATDEGTGAGLGLAIARRRGSLNRRSLGLGGRAGEGRTTWRFLGIAPRLARLATSLAKRGETSRTTLRPKRTLPKRRAFARAARHGSAIVPRPTTPDTVTPQWARQRPLQSSCRTRTDRRSRRSGTS